MLIEIHMLQNHSPANPNRDDLGAPKTALFGGRLRARISSQCLKRSIRWSPSFRDDLKGYLGVRTVAFPQLVADLLPASRIPQDEHRGIIEACCRIAKADKKRPEPEGDEAPAEEDATRTAQLIFLGPNEAKDFVARLERLRASMPQDYKRFLALPSPEDKGDEKKKKKGPSPEFWADLRQAYDHSAVDVALFGRMTTSDAFEDVEAAAAVAHAISTTELPSNEIDYFTAVDDLPRGPGSAYLDESQFNSSTFYKYFSIDWDGLVANLAGGDGSARAAALGLAAPAVAALIRAAAFTVPSGKRNSFAHNNLPDAILVEIKPKNVATSYANAFLVPARTYTDRDGDHDVVEDSIRKMGHYVGSLAAGYGIEALRLWFTTRPEVPFAAGLKGLEPVPTFNALLAAVSARLGEAEAEGRP